MNYPYRPKQVPAAFWQEMVDRLVNAIGERRSGGIGFVKGPELAEIIFQIPDAAAAVFLRFLIEIEEGRYDPGFTLKDEHRAAVEKGFARFLDDKYRYKGVLAAELKLPAAKAAKPSDMEKWGYPTFADLDRQWKSWLAPYMARDSYPWHTVVVDYMASDNDPDEYLFRGSGSGEDDFGELVNYLPVVTDAARKEYEARLAAVGNDAEAYDAVLATDPQNVVDDARYSMENALKAAVHTIWMKHRRTPKGYGAAKAALRR